MTSEWTFWSSRSDLWADILKDEKCARIVWHNIQHLSRRPLSNEATRAGKRYATMMASPAVNATGERLATKIGSAASNQ